MPLIKSRLRVQVRIAEIDEVYQSTFMPWMHAREKGTLPGAAIHVPDQACRHLRHLPRLRSLNLFSTRVTGTGLVHLLPLLALHHLTFNSMSKRERLAETSLLLLEDLPSLAHLDLCVRGLNDVALAAL